MEPILRDRVLELIREEGFELAGIAAARLHAPARATALKARAGGALADMAWMTDEWLERATDAERFLPGARSLLVVALPNHSPDPLVPAGGGPRGRVARYARGRDYHRVFEKRLRRIARRLREAFGAEARATVDYGPLLERPYAELAGLAWRGKSTMALAPGFGPWVMLGVVATTLDLEPDAPLKKSCGSCNRCIVACPTGAIAAEGFVLDSRLCISYHTIENRGAIPRELREHFEDWVFGCDACLDSCPVGVANFESESAFLPAGPDEAFPPLSELLVLDEQAFAERFRGRAIMRAKRDGLVRNACVALGNVGSEADFPALSRALQDASALVRGHAAWAIGHLGRRAGASEQARRVLENASSIEHDAYVLEEIALALDDIADGGPDG